MIRKLRVEVLELRHMLSVAPAVVPGDANIDGIVNGQDMALVASNWLETPANGQAGQSLPGDANGDGIVNGQDIALIASNWLDTPVTFARPELQLDATNAATVGTTVGGALLVATNQQYLTEANNASLDSTFNGASQMTIQLHIKQTTLGLDRTLVSRWGYGQQGTFAIDTGSHYGQQSELSIWLAKPNGQFGAVIITQGAHLVASRDYAMTLVFDGTQINPLDRVAIYIDGLRQAAVLDSGAIPTTLAASNAALEVGRWKGLGRYFDGAVHDLRLYNVAKGAAQVASLDSDSIGLVQYFPLTEETGPRVDALMGAVLADPTGVAREQTITSWTSTGTLPITFTPSPAGEPPNYAPHALANGQAALSFNGLNNALKYAAGALSQDASGDVFIVAQFTGGGDYFEGDTLFSSSSDTTAVDYLFFASYNPSTSTGVPGAGQPLARVRFRNDAFQADVRGNVMQLQPGVTYVMHFWGAGTGHAYGFTINGLDDASSYYTTSATGYALAGGSWYAASANLTNLTIGNFERSDGPQGWAAALIAEIDVYGGTPAQPVLPAAQAAAIVDYLIAKYGALRLGFDE